MLVLNRCFSLLYLAIVYAGITRARNDQYIGDKVIKMTPHSEKALNAMNNYFSTYKLDVWYGSSEPRKPCGVQVPQNMVEQTKAFCQQQQIDFKITIADVKKAIDDNLADNGNEFNGDKHWVDPYDYSDEDYAPLFNYTKYNRYDDIQTELHRLRFVYPDNIRVRTIGCSHEGRLLKLVRITSNVRDCIRKPVIWIEAGAHAREWITVAAGMFMVKELLEQNAKKNPAIKKFLQDHVIYFVPVVNPDGYEYSFTDDRLWRKTRTNYNGPTCIGADVNRNYDANWGGVGSSTDPCSLTYRGVFSESEPCVRIYSNVLRKLKGKLKAFWSLHSFLQLLLMPNSYTTTIPSDFTEARRIAETFASSVAKRFGTQYAFAPAPFLIGPSSGVSGDFVHDQLNVTYSYIVELRDRGDFGFLLPPNQIQPTALETLDGIVDAVTAI